MKELVKQLDSVSRDVEKLKSLQDSGSAGGVTSVTGTSPIVSSGGTTPAISLANSGVTPGSYTNAAFTVDIHGLVSAASSGSAPVAAVNGSAPITSSGGSTPTIGISINTTNDGGTIVKQGSYPGTQQASANINVDGSINAGTTFYKGGVEWMGSGTSFPGSPATNQRYFRTDQGIEYYYDGTRWLSVFLESISLNPIVQFTFGMSATTGYIMRAARLDKNYSVYVTEFEISFNINTTFDATNRWTTTIARVDSTGATTVIGSAVDHWQTGRTAGTPYVDALAVNAVFSTTNAYRWQAAFTKLNSPGTLDVSGIVVHYRLVG